MNHPSVLIKNGRVIDPAQKLDAPRDVLLRGGRVADVQPAGKIPAKGYQIVNAKGLVVAPGFIDLHVHLREPGQAHKETIASGTAAAAAGGFTSVCCMPNTSPVNDLPHITEWMCSKDRGAVVNVFPVAAATVGSMGVTLTDYAALKSAGAVAVSDDGKPILLDETMLAVMRAARRNGLPVVQHAEDTRMSHGCALNAGPTAFKLGVHGSPAEAEWSIVERDIRLARETGAHLHVAHVSTKRAVEAVRRAKRQGVRVTCEVTPHHFTLLDEHVGEYNTNFKMCPPLRSTEDREAMLEGLADGTIDCIATDHAPHASHEKQQEFERAPNGIIGLETAFGIACQVLHHHKKLPLTRVIAMLSSNPARVMGLNNRGTLTKGAHADVVLFDPNKKWMYSAAESKSLSRNTPYDGWELRGKIVKVFVNGTTL